MIKNISIINRLFIDSNMSKTTLKRVNLLLLFSFVWMLEALVSIPLSSTQSNPELVVKGHVFNLITVSIVLVFLYFKKYNWALVVFMLSVVLTILLFTNFITPGTYSEIHYLHVPLLMLVLTDNKKLIFISLIISYLGFVLPNKYLNIYSDSNYMDPFSSFIFFLISFLLVYFFKVNNLKNEKLLEDKKTELEELNKFQSQFFINISHEIRTPLTIIKGEVDKLKEIPSAKKIEEKLNQQIDRIKNIVDDVIDLSKMDNTSFNLNLELVDLKDIITKVFVSFQPLFDQKKIQFKFISSLESYIINGDEVYLERAINNLVLNAYKFTDYKGTVTLELITNDDTVSLMLTDNGIGISKKHISKVFKRFYQVDNDINKSGGSGVGLSFSKEIIDLHNGTFVINSKPCVGTNIELKFIKENTPANANYKVVINTEKTITQQLDLQNETSNNYTVLIVDDSYDLRIYLKEILNNYNCIEAKNGMEALSILRTSKIKFDLIISDYMMPKMDGLELLTNIKSFLHTIPVLMLTARTDQQSKIDLLTLEVDDYLNKPFEKEEFLIRVKNLLKQNKKRIQYLEKENISKSEIKVNSVWVKKLKTYIKENYSNPKLNQEEIAEHFNLSKSSFYRKVKIETGLTPNGFITEIKLQEARSIVENKKEITLKELSLQVGYLHTSYFVNKYEKRFGKHPLK
ncbi:signal transduction histidine kinase/DNA-binding response OmpR family regulator [Wenyingzhuangia heitensis]|uniref:histidine kinase n=1 Tax=Wenyingzhuangia heitensis TaxID=1487859 RepID=A0ABX0U4T4_9FLAO|nr:response regulator [Wenyingzhuangia heitensis]NIJ43864.1 signal transduction histidine kinase/DNA-binding response OmpR family regulator [Wenyingzhuangia heitensis]